MHDSCSHHDVSPDLAGRALGRLRRIAIAALLLAATVAHAQKPDDELVRVRDLFKSGMAHYNLTEYREALGDFAEAYRLKPDPAFLFNIAQSYRQLGESEKAAQFYRNYLRESPGATNRSDVERFIADADAAVAQARATRAPTAIEAPQIAPPPAAASTTPTTQPPPPPQQLSVTAPPPPVPDAPPPVLTTAPAIEGQPAAPRSRTWLWVGIGIVAVVAVGVGVGLAVGLSGSATPDSRLGTFTAVFQ